MARTGRLPSFSPLATVAIGLAACGGPAGGVDAAKIDAVFAQYAKNDSPGCALGVYRDGRVAYAKGYGMADLERNVAITPAMIFDLGSTSKQFAAASIILLANEGKLALTDDVRKYVPEVPDFGPRITIEHLVRHTSGLRDYNGLLFVHGFRGEDYTGDADALDIIARQKALNFAPGAKWDYSNTGFFLLSIIVERVTGKNLAAFAKERIFGPLGMSKTHFRNNHLAILPGRALAYSPADSGGFQIDLSDWDQLGDGAVYSSVEELIKWDENSYSPTVGGQALIDKLVEPGTLNDGKKHGYGRGLFLDSYRGVERVHHGGAWAGYRAMLMRFPKQHTSIALTCNIGTANTSGLAEQVADVVLADHFTEQTDAAPKDGAAAVGLPPDADRFVGTYFSEGQQQVVRIARDTAGLLLAFGGGTIPMKPTAANQFSAGGFLDLTFADGTPAPSFNAVQLGDDRGPYARVMPLVPTAAELDGVAGQYYSPELDVTWTIERSGDTVVVQSRGLGRLPMTPAFAGAFQVSVGLLRFEGPATRRTGFQLHGGRMLGLRFERR
ncbi:MAG: serine hydrolase domain-containing protein [Gemmatimonadales bacterium]